MTTISFGFSYPRSSSQRGARDARPVESTTVGLHTGECEIVDGKVAGVAVQMCACVAAEAETGDVLVSSTVKDLVADRESTLRIVDFECCPVVVSGGSSRLENNDGISICRH